jgi:hypothetical protein
MLEHELDAQGYKVILYVAIKPVIPPTLLKASFCHLSIHNWARYARGLLGYFQLTFRGHRLENFKFS